MCVICVKDSKSKKPDSELITRMYTGNGDLSGVSYMRNGLITTFRGLSLTQMLQVNNDIPEDTRAVYHFRIATTGTVNIMNSHPFVLGIDPYASASYSAYPTLSHNGIIRGIGDKKTSDTLQLVSWLEGMTKYNIHKVLTLLAENSTNKFALFTLTKTYLFGTFLTLNTLKFSNLFFNTYNEYWQYDTEGYAWKWNKTNKDTSTNKQPFAISKTSETTAATTGYTPKYQTTDKHCFLCQARLYPYEVELSKELDQLVCDDCYPDYSRLYQRNKNTTINEGEEK